jgi:hypothetical protein
VTVAVIYYKEWAADKALNEFTKEEIDALWLANTKKEGDGVHWVDSPQNTPQLQMWYSAEIQTEVRLEVIPLNEHWVERLIFATVPEGVKLMPEVPK